MSDARIGRLRRSYERSLGYAKFWIGVSVAFLAAFAAFAAERIWAISADPETHTPQNWDLLLIGAWVMSIAVFASLIMATAFIIAYHRADRALTTIEQGNADPG